MLQPGAGADGVPADSPAAAVVVGDGLGAVHAVERAAGADRAGAAVSAVLPLPRPGR